jgi:penicillin G amidase
MGQVSRVLRNTVAVLLLLVGIVLLAVWWVVRRSLPALDGSAALPGLRSGVIVDRDGWGRPWIRANSPEDLVMAQGYVMAQDRLWQMDILRRASAGELSEVFGSVALPIDEENRTLGMRLAAERAAAQSTPEISHLLEAYAHGVNAYLAERQSRLPIEFTMLGYKPRPWTLADTYLVSLYMYKTLTSTWKEKLNRQWIVDKVGADRASDLFVSDSLLDHFIVGGGQSSPLHSTTPPAAAPAERVSLAGSKAPPFVAEAWESARGFLTQFAEEPSDLIGSNNFVVSGAHTASGKPLLANDTHLGLGVPSIWYLVHLTAPGWNVEGFALPGAPLVIIGHNDRIAWGCTNSNADVQDLYAEQFQPDNSLHYKVGQSWVPADVRRETIHVRGAVDEQFQVVSTRHGPIVRRDPQKEGARAYALRWTALQPGGLDFGFPLLGRAKNWDEFIEITRHIGGPGQNIIYADVDGNIGFTIPARIPIRAHGNGVLPVAGDTDDYEWSGYIPFEELPRTKNPPDGIIATANARTVGPAYKYFVADRWAGPFRTERIYQLLSGRSGLRAGDMNAIQNDVVSLPDKFLADQLVAAARAQAPKDARAQKLIEELRAWDGRTTPDSVAASFVEYTRHALFHRLLAPYFDDRTSQYELWEPDSIYNDVWWRDKVFLENVLRTRPPAWLPSGFANYDDLLLASGDDAVRGLARAAGKSEVTAWRWGFLHPLDMPHPLGRAWPLHYFLSIGPYENGGTVDTVRAMGIGFGPAPRTPHGPAMRLVADLSNFDNSLMEVSTGESGQFASPHYSDQFPEWFAGRGIPAPFSDAAGDQARAHRLYLLPR